MPLSPTATERHESGRAGVSALTAFSGLFTLLAGICALAWPAGLTEVPFSRAAGAFQVGLGVGLLLALVWRDGLATVLAAFLVANTAHAYTEAAGPHVGDVGGRHVFAWSLGALSVLVALALWVRARQLGYVFGHPRPAGVPVLGPFVEQKTVLLTTYRRNGTPVPTRVSIAVDGDRALVRGFEKAGKTRRLRNDPSVEVAPCNSRGIPTGQAIRAAARLLDGDESRRAALLLRRKYPLLHGLMVPLAHRIGRSKTGRTVHFELIPEDVC